VSTLLAVIGPAFHGLAAQLPDAKLISEPGWGHDTLSSGEGGCAAPAVNRFLRGRRVNGCGEYRSPAILSTSGCPTPLRVRSKSYRVSDAARPSFSIATGY